MQHVFSSYDHDEVFENCGILPKHNIKTVHKMISHFDRDYQKKAGDLWEVSRDYNDVKISCRTSKCYARNGLLSFSHKREPDAGGGSSCVRQFMGKRKEQSASANRKAKISKSPNEGKCLLSPVNFNADVLIFRLLLSGNDS